MATRHHATSYLVIVLVAVLLSVVLAQLGTIKQAVQSDAAQLTYESTWVSQVVNGTYRAYSNETDAKVTFSFTGVAAAYFAAKGSRRGLCQIRIDEDDSSIYTIDLYDNSGYVQPLELTWSSPILPYGDHNVSISQIGPDARLGFYPYLFTATWVQTVPTNVEQYTATESPSTSTNFPQAGQTYYGTGSTVSIGPIIGGVIGAVVACFLLGFLIYLWRRDEKQKRRGEAVRVSKVKKTEGKMSIDDDDDDRQNNTIGHTHGGSLQPARSETRMTGVSSPVITGTPLGSSHYAPSHSGAWHGQAPYVSPIMDGAGNVNSFPHLMAARETPLPYVSSVVGAATGQPPPGWLPHTQSPVYMQSPYGAPSATSHTSFQVGPIPGGAASYNAANVHPALYGSSSSIPVIQSSATDSGSAEGSVGRRRIPASSGGNSIPSSTSRMQGPSPSSPNFVSTPVRAYPYHTQGYGDESRSYPVPEL